MESIIEKFRRLNRELYENHRPSHGARHYMAKVSGTPKEKARKAIQGKAQSAIEYEVRKGAIKRPAACQICGSERKLVAHHWNGYDHLFDVWWICHPCHRLLHVNHNGKLTLKQAKKLIYQKRYIQ